jgi:hypothetical protein
MQARFLLPDRTSSIGLVFALTRPKLAAIGSLLSGFGGSGYV